MVEEKDTLSESSVTQLFISGIIANFLWGFLILAPGFLYRIGYKPADVAFGRFIIQGICSTIALIAGWANIKSIFAPKLPTERWKLIGIVILFSLLSCSGYYTSMSIAIQCIGGTATVLFIGLLPVTIPIFGRDAPKSRRMFWCSIVTILAGFGVIHYFEINAIVTGCIKWTLGNHQLSLGHLSVKSKGNIAAFVALALWTAYGIMSSKYIKITRISKEALSDMVGFGALITMIPLWWCVNHAFYHRPNMTVWTVLSFFHNPYYSIFEIFLGAVAGFYAMRSWLNASGSLHDGLCGLFIVVDVLTGIFLWNICFDRHFRLREFIGGSLMVAGVVVGVIAYNGLPKWGKKPKKDLVAE